MIPAKNKIPKEKRIMKKFLAILMAAIMALSVVSVASAEPGKFDITIWCPEEAVELTKTQIEEFNNTVSAGLSENVTYIDTYSVLMQDGFETTDSLHYTDETTKHLYELFKEYFHWE